MISLFVYLSLHHDDWPRTLLCCVLCVCCVCVCVVIFFFLFQAEDGIRDLVRSRGLGDVYKRQLYNSARQIWDTQK